MVEIFIIISKFLFILYIALFLLNGFLCNLSEEGIISFNKRRGISNQRICIVLFHITASVILISSQIQYELTKTAGFCVAALVLIIAFGSIFRKLYPKGSHILTNSIIFLMDIGLVMLYRLNQDLAMKQIIWNSIGLVALIILPSVLHALPRLDKFRRVYIIISFVLLALTLILGQVTDGAKNWIIIGPISIQPSEIIKVLFVFYLASAFSKKPVFKELIAPVVCSGIIVLALVAQTDLGSGLIFYMTFLVMLFIATESYLYFVLGLGAISAASVVAYNIFSHIQVRVEAWLNPWADVAGSGYQIAQSLFAICTWGVTGIGLTRGYASSIPVVERDFIFAAICEEFGVIFAAGVILIFVLIFLEGAKGALHNNNRFLSLVCAGFTALFAFQSLLIIGGVIKMIPLTGVTLPFVSYGGTSILISYMIIAFMQWIIIRNNSVEDTSEKEKIQTSKRKRARV
ncbi:MAG: FtsW/RodA/SpoVE family cell cycle protein [Lachnospirales bacterium]